MEAGFAEVLLDLVYPGCCVGCGRADPDASRHFCWSCRSQFQIVERPFCSRCGDPVAGRIDQDYVCSLCARRDIQFDRARSVFRFEGPLAAGIRDFKYHGQTWLDRDFGDFLAGGFAAEFSDLEPPHAVMAVPMHPSRRRHRGYNQAHELARVLARRLRLPLWSGLLHRVRDTPTQTHLKAVARERNVRKAFLAWPARRVRGRRLLLVDDVMTTGATVNETSRALRQAGAERIYVLTLARG